MFPRRENPAKESRDLNIKKNVISFVTVSWSRGTYVKKHRKTGGLFLILVPRKEQSEDFHGQTPV